MPAGENSTALLRQLVFDLELDSDPDLSNHEHEVHKLYVRTLFMLILIVLTLNIHAITHKLKFHFLGHSALTILVGLIVAVIFTLFSYSSENTTIQLSSTFFYMVLLPPIIFEVFPHPFLPKRAASIFAKYHSSRISAQLSGYRLWGPCILPLSQAS